MWFSRKITINWIYISWWPIKAPQKRRTSLYSFSWERGTVTLINISFSANCPISQKQSATKNSFSTTKYREKTWRSEKNAQPLGYNISRFRPHTKRKKWVLYFLLIFSLFVINVDWKVNGKSVFSTSNSANCCLLRKKESIISIFSFF